MMNLFTSNLFGTKRTTEEIKNEAFLRAEVVPAVINGDYGYGVERKMNLQIKGYDNNLVQRLVNDLVIRMDRGTEKFSKSNNKAKEIIKQRRDKIVSNYMNNVIDTCAIDREEE